VSRLRITSRTREADGASFVLVEGGRAVERGASARAPGTTVEVADLFFNTPARRKFLHSPAGELRAALRLLECYALAYPEVGFRMTVDGRERLSWPALPVSGLTPEDRGGAPGLHDYRERASALWGARHAAPRGTGLHRQPALDPEPAALPGAAPRVREPASRRALPGEHAVAHRASRSPRRQRPPH